VQVAVEAVAPAQGFLLVVLGEASVLDRVAVAGRFAGPGVQVDPIGLVGWVRWVGQVEAVGLVLAEWVGTTLLSPDTASQDVEEVEQAEVAEK
jgi:hypothetical protein